MEAVVCVVNESDLSLPSGRNLSYMEKRRLTELQARAHLRNKTVKRDRKGNPIEMLEPLSDIERLELEDLAQARQDLELAHVAELRYVFAPAGEKGSAWLMPEGHARICLKTHPKRLRVLEPGEKPAVQPLRYRNVPSAFEKTFGYKTHAEMMAAPDHLSEALKGPGLVVEDGYVKDSIYPVHAPGEAVGLGHGPSAVAVEEAD